LSSLFNGRRINKGLSVLALLVGLGFSQITYAAVPSLTDADAFLPKPGLRIYAAGILGSDGTEFTHTLVSAKLIGDQLVSQSETELSYKEWKKEPFSVPKARVTWRYIGDDEGITKDPILPTRGYNQYLWLSRNVRVGEKWNSSWGSRREIMETGITVETPAGKFENCVMVEYDIYAGGTGIERHYLAPGVGLIKILSLKGPTATKSYVWYEVLRIEKVPLDEAAQAVLQVLKK